MIKLYHPVIKTILYLLNDPLETSNHSTGHEADHTCHNNDDADSAKIPVSVILVKCNFDVFDNLILGHCDLNITSPSGFTFFCHNRFDNMLPGVLNKVEVTIFVGWLIY